MNARSGAHTESANHYECLGVSPRATAAELQHAFRRAARDAHPDRHGELFSDRMAEINDAWRVLGNPIRRRAYDEMLALATSIFDPAPDPEPTAATWAPPTSAAAPEWRPTHRRRSKWRLMLSIESIALGALIVGSMLHATARSNSDGVLQSGDCVVLNVSSSPSEVDCSSIHNAVVERLVPFGTSCPPTTVPYRNRTGRICVVPVASATPPTASG